MEKGPNRHRVYTYKISIITMHISNITSTSNNQSHTDKIIFS